MRTGVTLIFMTAFGTRGLGVWPEGELTFFNFYES
jgi:hypothetical protein